MNFSKTQVDPKRSIVGFAIVVLLHVAVVYALVTGLAKKMVDVVRAPIETKVIEEIKKPPPPPEVVVPPPPKLEAPPPPFIPPPEVIVTPPPAPPQQVIVAVTPTPPPAPVEIAPAPPPPPTAVVAAPPPPPPAPAPPKPAVQTVNAICTTVVKPEVPSVDPVTAVISVSYTIVDGKVTKMDVVKQIYSTNIDRKQKRLIVAAIEAAAAQYVCPGNHNDVPQEFSFKIN